MTTTQSVLTAVADRFGIALREVATGGGAVALHARLESGQWLVASDECLMTLASRIALETVTDADGETRPAGWSVGIYPHNPETELWFGADSVVDVSDYDAYAADLPDMVGRALSALVNL